MTEKRGAVAGLGIIKALVWIVYALASAAIIVLAFAFVLLMFDANPNNAFAVLITDWGSAFARPFVGLIQPTPLSSGGAIAWSLLVAIAAYAVAAWVVGLLLGYVSQSLAQARYKQSEAVRASGEPSPAEQPTAPTPMSQTDASGDPASQAQSGTEENTHAEPRGT